MIVELTGTGGMARSYEEPWVEFRLRDYLKAVQAYTFHKSSAYHDWLALGFLKPQLSSVKFFDNNMPLERLHEEYSLPTVEISLAEIDRAQKRNLAVATDSLYASAQPDRKLWQRIIRLIALADAAGIRIYFFVPPRLETDNEMETVAGLWHKLDEKHKLRVNHSDHDLYTIENSYDQFHLNHKGAMRFTENMAAVFSQ